LLSKGKRFLFGRGIYSTPEIEVAALYAARFTHEDKNYMIVIQNRVNPETLIQIPKDQNGIGEYWVSPSEADIRPYGICIKEV